MPSNSSLLPLNGRSVTLLSSFGCYVLSLKSILVGTYTTFMSNAHSDCRYDLGRRAQEIFQSSCDLSNKASCCTPERVPGKIFVSIVPDCLGYLMDLIIGTV